MVVRTKGPVSVVDGERRLWTSKDQQRAAESELRLTESQHAADDRIARLQAEISKLHQAAATTPATGAMTVVDGPQRAYADQAEYGLYGNASTSGDETGHRDAAPGLIGLETLQARLRQKEAELRAAQNSVTAAEATVCLASRWRLFSHPSSSCLCAKLLVRAQNAALAEELATLAAERDLLATDTSTAGALQSELEMLQGRHAVALEVHSLFQWVGLNWSLLFRNNDMAVCRYSVRKMRSCRRHAKSCMRCFAVISPCCFAWGRAGVADDSCFMFCWGTGARGYCRYQDRVQRAAHGSVRMKARPISPNNITR